MIPVSISVGVPRFFKGMHRKELAPTWAMMKMSRQDYDNAFQKKLEKLEAKAIYEQLPDNAVLLCYEKPNDWCHRRMVAEWFENELGIVVEEVGLKREESFPYAECTKENAGKKRIVEEETGEYMPESVKKRLASYQEEKEPTLFDFM